MFCGSACSWQIMKGVGKPLEAQYDHVSIPILRFGNENVHRLASILSYMAASTLLNVNTTKLTEHLVVRTQSWITEFVAVFEWIPEDLKSTLSWQKVTLKGLGRILQLKYNDKTWRLLLDNK